MERLSAVPPAPLSREVTRSVETPPVSTDWNFLGSMESWERQFHKGGRARIAEVKPLTKKQLHGVLLGTMDPKWRKQLQEEVGPLVTFFDPTVQGREWDPINDAKRESLEMVRDAAFPVVGIDSGKLGVGASFELGPAALASFLTGRELTLWVTQIDENVVKPEDFKRVQRLRRLTQINSEHLEALYEKGKIIRVNNVSEAVAEYEKTIQATLERRDRPVTSEDVITFIPNTEKFQTFNRVNVHGASKYPEKIEPTLEFLQKEGILVDNYIVDLPEEQWIKDDYALYRKELRSRTESLVNFSFCQPYSYGSVEDPGMDWAIAAAKGTYSIIYMPSATQEEDPDGNYNRARALLKSHLTVMHELYPWIADYVRVTDSLEEAHQYMRTIMNFAPEADKQKPAETTFDTRKPERFQRLPEKEIMYTPNRITQEIIHTPDGRIQKDSKRIVAFQSLLEDITYASPQILKEKVNEKKVRQRLYDLVIGNAAGRIFPVPNTAADVIPVATGWKPEQLQVIEAQGYNPDNCIVLGIGKDGLLRVIGGFKDFGEELAFTGKREFKEEAKGTIRHIVPFDSFSEPTRDKRFIVVSGAFGATVDVNELGDTDEIAQVIVVPLMDKNGKFNESILQENQDQVDMNGNHFSHQGLRADHGKIIRGLHKYWKIHGKDNNLTLRATIERMSTAFPQELIGAEAHAEEPTQVLALPVVQSDGQSKNLRVTDNILFVLQNAAEIFRDAGYPDAEERAIQFAQKAVEIDVLPPYPQGAVAADAFIVRNDNIIVQRFPKADGKDELRLVGTYYGPEIHEAGQNLDGLINAVVAKKAGLHVTADVFLGVTGNSMAVDPRYPRSTFVYAGTPSSRPLPMEPLADGSILSELPIWNEDKSDLSDELLKANWGFGHKDLLMLLKNYLSLQDPQHIQTAQSIIDNQY